MIFICSCFHILETQTKRINLYLCNASLVFLSFNVYNNYYVSLIRMLTNLSPHHQLFDKMPQRASTVVYALCLLLCQVELASDDGYRREA